MNRAVQLQPGYILIALTSKRWAIRTDWSQCRYGAAVAPSMHLAVAIGKREAASKIVVKSRKIT